MKSISQYEVHCPRCKVTFAPETKKCLHCGGRTGPSIVQLPDHQPAFGEPDHARFEMAEFAEEAESPFVSEPEIEEGGGRFSSLLRSAGTLVWVVMAIAFAAIRTCSDN
jgi:hypothetical protein